MEVEISGALGEERGPKYSFLPCVYGVPEKEKLHMGATE